MQLETRADDLDDRQLVEALRDASRFIELANAAGGPRLVQVRYGETSKGRSDVLDRQIARARSWTGLILQLEPAEAALALRLFVQSRDGEPAYPTYRALGKALGVSHVTAMKRVARGLHEFRRVLARIEGTVALDHLEAAVKGREFRA